MNADQLWETTMDPKSGHLSESRCLMRSLPTTCSTMLMGEDVPPRRAFIEKHALSVKNLDI